MMRAASAADGTAGMPLLAPVPLAAALTAAAADDWRGAEAGGVADGDERLLAAAVPGSAGSFGLNDTLLRDETPMR